MSSKQTASVGILKGEEQAHAHAALKQTWHNWAAAEKAKDKAWEDYCTIPFHGPQFEAAADANDLAREKCKQAYLAAYPGKNIADFNDFVIAGPDKYRS